MPLDPADTASLVAALLAVNYYPVDRAYGLMPAFRERGLLDPAKVAAMPHSELIAAMGAAGYDRGGFVPILSFRLYALMEAIAAGSLDALRTLTNDGRKEEFVDTLAAVQGFGPRTAATAWELFRASASR
jgi:hypothetical protein